MVKPKRWYQFPRICNTLNDEFWKENGHEVVGVTVRLRKKLVFGKNHIESKIASILSDRPGEIVTEKPLDMTCVFFNLDQLEVVKDKENG